jgi:hypothetical protein
LKPRGDEVKWKQKRDKQVRSTFALNLGRRLALTLASCPNWWTADGGRPNLIVMGGHLEDISRLFFLQTSWSKVINCTRLSSRKGSNALDRDNARVYL